MKKYYKVAGLTFTISGQDEGYYNALTDYFSDKEVNEAQESPLIEIVVSIENNDVDFQPDFYSLAGSVSFNHTTYRIKKRHFTYTVSNLFDKNKPTRVVLHPTVSWLYTKALIAGTEVDYHNKYRVFASAVTNYSGMWYLFAITLMKVNQAFIHCGMMSNKEDGTGIILTGTGGCGKTSIMMELITSGGYQYMSEDFGIVGKDGKLFDMQKKAAIYQSDVKWGNPYLRKAIKKLPLSQRIEWDVKKNLNRNPLHYFKPVELFGDNISHQSQLRKVFYLKRAQPGRKIECNKMPADHIAERAKTASFRELKELYEILSNIRAVGGVEYYNDYPSVFELENQYTEIMYNAFKDVECYELLVPLRVNPKDTVKFIID